MDQTPPSIGPVEAEEALAEELPAAHRPLCLCIPLHSLLYLSAHHFRLLREEEMIGKVVEEGVLGGVKADEVPAGVAVPVGVDR